MIAADELAASDVALTEALRAAVLADAAPLGMALAERAGTRPGGLELTAAADLARERFRPRTGRIDVRCPSSCHARIDGEVPLPFLRGWVLSGEHGVEIAMEGRTERLVVDVPPGGTATVGPRPTAGERLPVPHAAKGVSSTWFWVGASVTALALTATTLSALDVAAKHSDFEAHPSPDRADDGHSAQTRTNVLIGISAGAAAATALLGLFVVDWSAGPSTRMSAGVLPGGGAALVETSF
jgi:hypothetical protein